MTNAVFSVSTTATLVFSGTGKVKLQVSGNACYLGGDNTVSSSNGFAPAVGSAYDFDFQAPSEIWAVSVGSSGVRVLGWY